MRNWPLLLQFRENFQDLVVGHETARIGDPDVTDNTVFVDDHPRAFRAQISRYPLAVRRHGGIVVEDAVRARHFAAQIGEQRVLEPELLAPRFVGIVEVDTDAQDLGIRGLELGKIKLKGQRFLRSSVGECADIEEQDDRFLATEITEPDVLARR